MVENHRAFPDAALQHIITLIPKSLAAGPADQRPISVGTFIYRLWATIRAKDLSVWQESWVHMTQHGFRAGKRCIDPAWTTAAGIEYAKLKGMVRSGFSLDLAKAFDSIDHDLLHLILLRLKLPVEIVLPWIHSLKRTSKWMKTGFGLGNFPSLEVFHWVTLLPVTP